MACKSRVIAHSFRFVISVQCKCQRSNSGRYFALDVRKFINSCQFAIFTRATPASAVFAVATCPSVRSSVRHVGVLYPDG